MTLAQLLCPLKDPRGRLIPNAIRATGKDVDLGPLLSYSFTSKTGNESQKKP